MFLLVSSIMSILSFVYSLDYTIIFYALSNKHFDFFLIIKIGGPEFITCSCCSMFIVCVVFSRSLLVFLSFLFFLPLYLSVLSCIYCLVIDLRLQITPLVSSNFSRIIRIDSSS